MTALKGKHSRPGSAKPAAGWRGIRWLLAFIGFLLVGQRHTSAQAPSRSRNGSNASAFAHLEAAEQAFRRYSLAVSVYKKLLDLNPRQLYLFRHGALLRARSEFKEAYGDVTRAVMRRTPLSANLAADILTSYARFAFPCAPPDPAVSLRLRDFPRALALLQEAIHLDPRNVGANLQLAYLYDDLSFVDWQRHAPRKVTAAAAADFRREVHETLKLDPSNDNALFLRALMLQSSRAGPAAACLAYAAAAKHLATFSLALTGYHCACYQISWQIAVNFLKDHEGLPGAKGALRRLPVLKPTPGEVFHQWKHPHPGG